MVVNADPALLGLISEWLAPEGCRVVEEPVEAETAREDCEMIVVDVPFPRQGGAELLRRIASRHAGVPVLALSSGFFPGIGANGAVAHALEVASVLAKPLTRHALVTAVDRLLRRTG